MSRHQDNEDLQRQQQVEDEASEYRYFLDNDPGYQAFLDNMESTRLTELEKVGGQEKPF